MNLYSSQKKKIESNRNKIVVKSVSMYIHETLLENAYVYKEIRRMCVGEIGMYKCMY